MRRLLIAALLASVALTWTLLCGGVASVICQPGAAAPAAAAPDVWMRVCAEDGTVLAVASPDDEDEWLSLAMCQAERTGRPVTVTQQGKVICTLDPNEE